MELALAGPGLALPDMLRAPGPVTVRMAPASGSGPAAGPQADMPPPPAAVAAEAGCWWSEAPALACLLLGVACPARLALLQALWIALAHLLLMYCHNRCLPVAQLSSPAAAPDTAVAAAAAILAALAPADPAAAVDVVAAAASPAAAGLEGMPGQVLSLAQTAAAVAVAAVGHSSSLALAGPVQAMPLLAVAALAWAPEVVLLPGVPPDAGADGAPVQGPAHLPLALLAVLPGQGALPWWPLMRPACVVQAPCLAQALQQVQAQGQVQVLLGRQALRLQAPGAQAKPFGQLPAHLLLPALLPLLPDLLLPLHLGRQRCLTLTLGPTQHP